MSFIWSTALKDWRRHRRNPAEFAIWLGIPLLIGALIILAFGGRGGPAPQIHLLVTDEDDSFISRFLVGALSQEALGGMIRAEEVAREDGTKRMTGGEATALLIIPDGFAEAALREEPVVLRLLTNPAQRIWPGIVEESLSILVDSHFYLSRLIGDDLRLIAEGPPAGRNTMVDSFVSEFGVRINHITERLSRYLDPMVIQLETHSGEDLEAEEETSPSLGFLFLPSILFMSLMFVAQSLSAELWTERMEHTLRRVVVSPRGVLSFLAGKLLAGLGVMLLICVLAMLIGFGYFHLNPAGLPLAIAWAGGTGLMLLALMTLLQLWSPSQRGGNVITTALLFPLMMIGGSFFPFEAMPAWMATVGGYTPNGWALQRLKAILLETAEPGSVLTGFVVLAAVTLLLTLLGVLRLRRGFAQG